MISEIYKLFLKTFLLFFLGSFDFMTRKIFTSFEYPSDTLEPDPPLHRINSLVTEYSRVSLPLIINQLTLLRRINRAVHVDRKTVFNVNLAQVSQW